MRTRSTLGYTLAVMFVLVFSSLIGAPQLRPASGAGTGSCTASNTFNFTLYPAPTSLNFLGAFATSNVELEGMLWFPIDPAYLNTGGPFTNFSTTDVITHNSNYTIWQFHVKPGLMWSDGTPVAANDILATYGQTFTLNASYDVLNLRQQITKEFAVNSSTAEFVLNQSNAYLPTDFDIENNHVYPASMIQKDGVNSNFFNNLVVMGPFVPVNYVQGSTQMVLAPNPYFKPSTQVCQINLSFTEVEGLNAALVQSGSSDLAEISYATAASLQSLPNIHILDESARYMQDLQYNVTLYPFNMTAFRQAIVYGINDSAIIQSAFNGYAQTGYQSQGTIPPSVTSYYSPHQMNYSFSPTKAVSLLNSIGITGGANGAPLKYPNGTRVTITLDTDTSKSFDVTSVQVMATDLQSIGFNVVTNTMSEGALFSLPGVGAAQVLIFTTGGVIFPNILFDSIPGWEVYSPAPIPQAYWEWPPSVNTEYNNNLTSLEATSNPAQIALASDNIQAINSVNLPTIVTAYPDDLWAYSTAHWSNWTPSTAPSGYANGFAEFNPFEISTLVPAVQATSSTQTTSTSTTGVTSTGTQATSTSTGSTSSSSSIAINASYWLVLAAAAIILVALSFGYLFTRRQPAQRNTV